MHATFNPSLPVYRMSDVDGALREGRVASVNELRKRRMQPAAGQEPVGQYWSGYMLAELYRAADCVPMKPLSAKQQARWDWHRTCHRCGQTGREPWDKDWRFWLPGSGVWSARPSCYPCKRVEDDVQWKARANRDRFAAVNHARRLLADDTLTVLIEERITPGSILAQDALRVTAVDAAGTVLLDDTVRYVHEHMGPEPVWEQGRPIAEIADQVRTLAGRTLIALPAWWPDRPGLLQRTVLHALGEDMALTAIGAGPIYNTPDGEYDHNAERLGTAFGGAINTLAGHWRGQPQYPHSTASGYKTPSRAADAFAEFLDAEPGDLAPARQAVLLLRIVARIAADDHPAGPARCPQRDSREEEPCGRPNVKATGMCPEHTPIGQPPPTPGGTS